MLNKEPFYNFLNLLHIDIVLGENNGLFIFDFNSNQNIKLHKTNDYYECMLYRDGESFVIRFNQDMFQLNNNRKETILLENEQFSFFQKEDDSDYNQSFIHCDSTNINFYSKNVDDSTIPCTCSIKILNNFEYLKVAYTFRQNGLLKNDFIIQKEEGKSVRKGLERRFNENGLLVFNDSFSQDIFSVYDSIQEELKGCTTIPPLLHEMNSMIPGIVDYLIESYPNFKVVMDNVVSSKQKKL